MERQRPSDRNGGFLFAADPQKAFDKQPVFWAPEALPTVLPLREAFSPGKAGQYYLDLKRVPGGEFRQGPDGWHGILPLGGAVHRVCLPRIPNSGSRFAVELVFDGNFDISSHAAHRLMSAIKGRRLGTPPIALPRQRRRRLILAIRALDAWLEGNSYRVIAEGLFGKERIGGRPWPTSDLRSRIIRLVRDALAMVRGGYRALLHPPPRKK